MAFFARAGAGITDRQTKKINKKTFTFGYDSYIIIIIMGGR